MYGAYVNMQYINLLHDIKIILISLSFYATRLTISTILHAKFAWADTREIALFARRRKRKKEEREKERPKDEPKEVERCRRESNLTFVG